MDKAAQISQDGSRFVFVRSTDLGQEHMGFGQVWRGWDIYAYDLSKSKTYPLTQKKYHVAGIPQFFHQDKSILFLANDVEKINGNWYLYQFDFETGNTKKFFDFDVSNFVLSDDKQLILYGKQDRTEFIYRDYLVLRDLKTGLEQIIFKPKSGEYLIDFSISPNKKLVAIITNTGKDRIHQKSDLYLLNVSDKKNVKIRIKDDWKLFFK